MTIPSSNGSNNGSSHGFMAILRGLMSALFRPRRRGYGYGGGLTGDGVPRRGSGWLIGAALRMILGFLTGRRGRRGDGRY